VSVTLSKTARTFAQAPHDARFRSLSLFSSSTTGATEIKWDEDGTMQVHDMTGRKETTKKKAL
jgi:hypothetical protein